MRMWLNWRSLFVGATVAASAVVLFAIGAQGAVAPGELASPTGTDPQTGQALNPTHWEVVAGDTITDTILNATDAQTGSGSCASDEVLVTIQSSNFGNQTLCGTLSGSTITFTWTATSDKGVCGTTIVSYNEAGHLSNNTLLPKGKGDSAAGLAIVDSSGNVIQTCVPQSNANPLTVTKDANGSYLNTFAWDISKRVDNQEIDTSATSAVFNYTVTVQHDDGTISGVKVNGTITVTNPNVDSVNINPIADQLSDGTICAVNGGGSQSLPSGSTQFKYECDLAGLPSAPVTNTVTVSWPDQHISDGALAADSATFTTAAVAFNGTAVNDCVNVNDTLGGLLGKVCVGGANPTTFTYPITVQGIPGTCVTRPNTATFTANTTGTTGSASQTVKLCVAADPQVTKTATPSFTRTYAWDINKAVDKSIQDVPAGTKATFNYSITADETGFTDSNWSVTGTITVTNPNDWESVTLTGVTDAIDDGGTCVITGNTTATLGPKSSTTLAYACSFSSQPSYDTAHNTGTATWDSIAALTPHGTASATVPFTFNDGTAGNPTRVNQSVTITDSFNGGTAKTLGTLTAVDTTPFTSRTFSESQSIAGVAGTCTSYPNTATILETGQSSSQSVLVCVGLDLEVSKTATPSFTRTYNWNIAKSVDKTLLDAGGTANYTVTVTETGFTDSNIEVTGSIVVANPNDWESITANVTDNIDHGGICSVTGGSNATIAASSSSTFNYTCTFASVPSSGVNTGTATWDASAFFTPDGTASGTAGYAFGSPTARVNATIFVFDSLHGLLGSATAVDSPPLMVKLLTYTLHFNPPSSGCQTVNNTATIIQTGQSASASVQVCNTGALTMGFWQNKNGQAIIKNGAAPGGVCASGTWLRQYAPFQDLSATASCSAVATYFTNVFNAANAGGSSMNAMLKAQMLATALDVYFSDPTLGGNKINAPAPIGGVVVDLTKIYGSENVSAAFGGATSMTISQMLSYAASQSSAGGSNWYNQNKATQGLAKDAFDSINNQTIVSP